MKTHIATLLSIILFIILGISSVKAQLPYSSQFFTSRLNLNPAFTGIDNLSRISLDGKSYFFPYRGGSLFSQVAYEQAFGDQTSQQGIGLVLQNG